MTEMARLQLEEAKERLPQLEEEIKFLLIPKDPEDSKNAVMEIRAGTGGDEASIFAGDLYRMYSKYCQDKGWSVSVMDMNEGDLWWVQGDYSRKSMGRMCMVRSSSKRGYIEYNECHKPRLRGVYTLLRQRSWYSPKLKSSM